MSELEKVIAESALYELAWKYSNLNDISFPANEVKDLASAVRKYYAERVSEEKVEEIIKNHCCTPLTKYPIYRFDLQQTLAKSIHDLVVKE